MIGIFVRPCPRSLGLWKRITLPTNTAKNRPRLQQRQQIPPCFAYSLSRQNADVHFCAPLFPTSQCPALQRALPIYRERVRQHPSRGRRRHPLSIADREASSAGSGGPEVILELLAFGAAMG